MQLLRQSTAATRTVGPVLDTSGNPVTTAVAANFSIVKNGTVAALSSETVTHASNGHYAIDFTTTNTNTLGELAVIVNNSAMAMTQHRYTVLTATAYDTLVTNGTLASTTSGRTLAVDASGIVTDTAGTTTLLSRLTSTRAGLLDNLDVAISTIQSQITALNNLSAKANWFGSALLEIPDSGTRAYVFELVIKDDEDKLVNLDGLPTITLANSAGTDRSSLITTGIANAATGRYTLTITVGTSTTNEALLLKATGTVSGETRYAVLATQVVDYDSGSIINSIYTTLGVPATSTIAGDIAAVKTVADTVASDTTTLKNRITVNLFSGITYMKNWLAIIMGKAADNTTKAEVNATTAGATYDQTTDSLEAQKDAGGGGGGSGDASQTTLLEVQDTVNDILSLVSSATITTTGYARLDANGVLLLKRGDTSTITFTSTTSNVVPDTSDSTTKVFFGVRDAAGRNFVTIEASDKLVNTGLQSYRFSPTAAQAKLIPKGKHYFDVMVMYGYTAGTAPAEGKPGTPATYTSLRTFVSGRCDVDDLMIEPSEVY